MPLDFPRARPLLQSCNLPKLFVEELGWEPARQKLTLRAGEADYTFTAIAEKRGFTAWLCESPTGGLPNHATRLKLDRKLSETSFEHLIVFVTGNRASQSWMWVRREQGKPLAARTHEYHRSQPGDSLLQKLQILYVSLEEEEAGLSTVAVAGRARTAFDIERVTKAFYRDFDTHRKAFLKFIDGIGEVADCEWYASVMLNRLMFVYFIQRKGFLDGDRDYLRNRLQRCQQEHGRDKFYTFYRYFLLRLFHEGFGKRRKDRAPDLEKLLGNIPYLNGGLFDVHELEKPERYGKDIQIPDKAFERIFDYFDQYQWHLDERPLRADNEINPDVLGYIFEKYINQKQMGAYYTKEDITEYISKNTVLPFLFDAARARCKVAFEQSGTGVPPVWDLLRENPDRYIYDAVKKGVEIPLPKEIAAGIKDVSKRGGWNKLADEEYRLPTEIWREVVARRQRYEEIRKRLAGEMEITGGTPVPRSESDTAVPAVSQKRGNTGGTPVSRSQSGTGVPAVVFQPFDPSQPVNTTERNLPHWRQDGATYFITFRLGDSLPQTKLRQWKSERETWLKHNPSPWSKRQQQEYADRFPQRLQDWLDAGDGSCVLADPRAGEIVENALRHFDGERYILDHYVVMPNHVHALVAPKSGHSLPDILHSWKSFTAHAINKTLNREGGLWLDESFDHVVRNLQQLDFYRAYIRENPVKARLQPGSFRADTGAGIPAVAGNGEEITGGTPVPPSWNINDFITLNLDLRQFAQDVIENCEGTDLLMAFWQAISGITVLDPTGGSGAFIFAALNILEPLYEACLDRMEAFLAEWDGRDTGVPPVNQKREITGGTPVGQERGNTGGTPVPLSGPLSVQAAGRKTHPNYHKKFTEVLTRVDAHPNRRYFILKSIILNNLYAVDIMEEAVEICKLRLFLKLAAQVEPDTTRDNLGIEPLPDIDFNIRAGNTLVGYATKEEVQRCMKEFGGGQMKLMDEDELGSFARFNTRCADVEQAFSKFRQLQTEGDGSVPHADKQELQKRLKALEDELNRHLATEYGVKVSDKVAYEKWLKSHQPFHWFIQFYGILANGGFDVIIGNPPYVEYNKVESTYKVRGHKTRDCGNLYAFVLERSEALVQSEGRLGFIVPIALVSVSETLSARELLCKQFPTSWFSNFAIRPAKLFEGVEQRLTIWLAQANESGLKQAFTTKYLQWYKDERPTLFARLEYEPSSDILTAICIPKLGCRHAHQVVKKVLQMRGGVVAEGLVSRSRVKLFFHRTPGYWIRIMDFEPHFRSPTATRSVHHIRELAVKDDATAKFIGAVISSSLYFCWFFAMGNCRNLTLEDVKQFQIGRPSPDILRRAGKLFDELMADFQKNSFVNTRGDTEFQEFNWGISKPIIDRLDAVLAEHYGLTAEELDFVASYDIKIRMGKDASEEEAE